MIDQRPKNRAKCKLATVAVNGRLLSCLRAPSKCAVIWSTFARGRMQGDKNIESKVKLTFPRLGMWFLELSGCQMTLYMIWYAEHRENTPPDHCGTCRCVFNWWQIWSCNFEPWTCSFRVKYVETLVKSCCLCMSQRTNGKSMHGAGKLPISNSLIILAVFRLWMRLNDARLRLMGIHVD